MWYSSGKLQKQEYRKEYSEKAVKDSTYKSSLQLNRQVDDYRWKLSMRRPSDGAEAYTPLIQ